MVLVVEVVLMLLRHSLDTKETLLQEVQHILYVLLVLVSALVVDSIQVVVAVVDEDVHHMLMVVL
tara:strand:+ start:286 stop:480 length:195 start_codon:yes stop_codon:yes gene_type:complete